MFQFRRSAFCFMKPRACVGFLTIGKRPGYLRETRQNDDCFGQEGFAYYVNVCYYTKTVHEYTNGGLNKYCFGHSWRMLQTGMQYSGSIELVYMGTFERRDKQATWREHAESATISHRWQRNCFEERRPHLCFMSSDHVLDAFVLKINIISFFIF